MKCIAGIILAALIGSAGPGHAESLYVSPTGDDSNSGTQAAPLRTLEGARIKARGLASSMSSDLNIFLEDGTYALIQPVLFTSEDSGRNGHVIHYRNAPGAHPILSGGKTVGGWTLHDAHRNIWMASVAETDNFRQIYVNGVKAVRARSDGAMGLKKTDNGYRADKMLMADFKNPSDMEVVAEPHSWEQVRLPIAAIVGGDVTIKEPCWKFASQHEYPGYSNPQWIENAYEFLAKPGSWYLDRRAHTLFYIPRLGEDMMNATVEVPISERLIQLAGSAKDPVASLEFFGLSFRLTNWLLPSTDAGFISDQANQLPGPSMVAAAIDCAGAQHVTIQKCDFADSGGNGINILSASKNVTVNECSFHDLAGAAVQIGAGAGLELPRGSPEIVAGVTVSNCTVHDVDTDYQCGCGIFAGLVQDCAISHNELYNLPYTAISMGWGWGKACAFTSGNKIIGNKIHDHMRVLVDGGAIYCNGYQEGGLIQGNYIYAQSHLYGELYLDDGSTNWTVTQNVCKKSGEAWIVLAKGSNNRFRENYWEEGKLDIRKGDTSAGAVVVKGGDWPPAAQDVMNAAGPVK